MIDAAMADSMEAKLEQADELAESSPAAAAAQYESLIVSPETGEEATKVKEQAIYRLGEVYAKSGEATKLGALLTNLRPFFATIPKAKTAKIVRRRPPRCCRGEGAHHGSLAVLVRRCAPSSTRSPRSPTRATCR